MRSSYLFLCSLSLTLLSGAGKPESPRAFLRATFVVNETGTSSDVSLGDGLCDANKDQDGDQCTLTAALQEANRLDGHDEIAFAIASLDGVQVSISSPVTLSGTLEGGGKVTLGHGNDIYTPTITVGRGAEGTLIQDFSLNGWIALEGDEARLERVTFTGDGSPNGDRTMLVVRGNDNVVGPGNEFSGNSWIAVVLASGGSGNRVVGNSIVGPLVGGFPSRVYGIRVQSSDNIIGGPTPEERNVISGASNCITIESYVTGTRVQGNYIGTDATGTTRYGGSTYGIYLLGPNNVIGGIRGIEGNVISGHSQGIHIQHGGNVIQGNYIGTDATGTQPIPNGDGIYMLKAAQVLPATTIGATGDDAADRGNVIAYNSASGIRLNQVGVNFPTGVTIAANSIFENGDATSFWQGTGLGIDLAAGGSTGVTTNDIGDADTGPNNLQNYPELFLVGGGGTVKGMLDSTPDAEFRIEVFGSSACDVRGYGEGEDFLGDVIVTTGPDGRAVFDTGIFPLYDAVTATATDSLGNTSEFSACACNGVAKPDGTYACGSSNVIVVNVEGDEPNSAEALVRDLCHIGSNPTDEDPSEPVLNECTLRAAIELANKRSGEDRIEFDLDSSIPSIALSSSLPALEEAVTIDGHTGGSERVDVIGEDAGDSADGLLVRAANVGIFGMGIRSFGKAGIMVDGVADAVIGSPEDGMGNTIFGNVEGIRARAAADLTIQGNCIGAENCENAPEENDQLGIRILDGSSVQIGGPTEDEGNVIFGGVHVTDSPEVSLRYNEIEVPEGRIVDEAADVPAIPLDLGSRGVSCLDLHPPGVFTLDAVRVTGRARPGDVVELFRVEALSSDRGRYFARHVKPEGSVVADQDGDFEIFHTANQGKQLVLTVTHNGQTSEITQARYPVIFVPGIGGSWLVADGNRELWLPDGRTDATQNQNLYDMRMTPDGTSAIPSITAPLVLENPLGFEFAYGPTMAFLEGNGYVGSRSNSDPATLDLWRFPYDWRREVETTSGQLEALIGKITGSGDQVAFSCGVDIVAHSMGNLLTSYYIRSKPEESRRRVHRYVSMAAPMHGTPQAIAAHTKGYVFDVETLKIYGTGFDIDWSRMIQMARNISGIYVLGPSDTYWRSADMVRDGYMQDLDGNWLTSHETTIDFLTRRKEEDGLARNRLLWERQIENVHSVIDDWRNWNGPPGIYRLVGDKPFKTAVGWFLLPPPYAAEVTRTELADNEQPGDTERHGHYRSAQAPLVGRGDGTVALSSATMGHLDGVEDFSGVDQNNPWLGDFERFDCLHAQIMTPDAEYTYENLEDPCESGRSMQRALEILQSGTTVITPTASKGSVAKASSDLREIFYVSTTARAAVYVEDEEGNRTGPASPDSLNKIIYGIRDIGYWPNDGGTVVSLDPGKSYDIEVTAPNEETLVRLTRLTTADAARFDNSVYSDQTLAPGGRLVWQTGSEAVHLDGNGDGSFDEELAPAVILEGSTPAPAVPVPAPLDVTRSTPAAAPRDQEVALTLPGDGWAWSASVSESWISLDRASGVTPDAVTVTLAASVPGEGRHEGTVHVTMGLGDYRVTYPIRVQLDVADQRTVTSVRVTPEDARVVPGGTLQFFSHGIDQLGDPRSVQVTWSSSGGTIDAGGLYTAGSAVGRFEVTATDVETGISGSASVEVTTAVGTEEEPVPTEFRLFANYPNPFNPSTTLTFALPGPQETVILVYDMLGRVVARPLHARLSAGIHRLDFDARGLPSGAYLYVVSAGPHRAAGRMLLLK